MALLDDLEDLQKFWEQRSFLGRVVLAIGCFASALSIGSLADGAFAFKGFIVTAIEGYREVMGWLYQWLAALLNVHIPQPLADLLVIYVFMIGIWHKIDVPDSEVLHGWQFARRFCISALVIVALAVGLVRLGLPPLIGLLLSPLLTPFLNVFSNPTWRPTPSDWKFFRAAVAIYLFVGAVAAVSEGFARPMG